MFFHVDLTRVTGKQEFLDAAGKALQFPEYFGSNWDAFEECITDMSWHRADGFVLLFEGWGAFAGSAPAETDIARSILQDASRYWEEQGSRFFAVLT